MTIHQEVLPATGKLGILMPGMGAVSTTFIAGCLLAKRGLAEPIGSYTQLGHLLKTDTAAGGNKTGPLLKDALPLAGLQDLVFGGWDLFADNAYQAALTADVLSLQHLNAIQQELEAIQPMPAVFFPEYVKKLRGEHIKTQANKWELAQAVRHDIRAFKDKSQVSRCVAIWCGSTEAHQEPTDVHQSLATFEQGLKNNAASISPSMIYAYACLQEQVPYANGAPNLTAEIPALFELADKMNLPTCGKDFKTGQTLIKTVVAPGLKARMLGIRGWFSTNILGNRDGQVLEDKDSFRSKEVSKLGVLENIFEPHIYPALYGDMYHKVRIEYYPPRGDQKEGWDNIDLFGWLGYPMQLKINFLCRDSILAAPIVLDLALLLDLAARSGLSGPQPWLSYFFKSPVGRPETMTQHDLFEQLASFQHTLQQIKNQSNKKVA